MYAESQEEENVTSPVLFDEMPEDEPKSGNFEEEQVETEQNLDFIPDDTEVPVIHLSQIEPSLQCAQVQFERQDNEEQFFQPIEREHFTGNCCGEVVHPLAKPSKQIPEHPLNLTITKDTFDDKVRYIFKIHTCQVFKQLTNLLKKEAFLCKLTKFYKM